MFRLAGGRGILLGTKTVYTNEYKEEQATETNTIQMQKFVTSFGLLLKNDMIAKNSIALSPDCLPPTQTPICPKNIH